MLKTFVCTDLSLFGRRFYKQFSLECDLFIGWYRPAGLQFLESFLSSMLFSAKLGSWPGASPAAPKTISYNSVGDTRNEDGCEAGSSNESRRRGIVCLFFIQEIELSVKCLICLMYFFLTFVVLYLHVVLEQRHLPKFWIVVCPSIMCLHLTFRLACSYLVSSLFISFCKNESYNQCIL